MHKKLRVLASLGGAAVSLMLLATPASAGNITSPSANPYSVPGDASGAPKSFTVTAGGFTPGSVVLIEQCDGVPSTTAGWTPTDHCDLATSPAEIIVGAGGTVTFPANDNNYGFTPFKGLGPSGGFTCGSPSQSDPADGVPYFENCQVRVSTSNQQATADQTFLTMTLPDAETVPPSTPEVPFAILLPLGGVAAAGGFFFLRNRRAPSSVAA